MYESVFSRTQGGRPPPVVALSWYAGTALLSLTALLLARWLLAVLPWLTASGLFLLASALVLSCSSAESATGLWRATLLLGSESGLSPKSVGLTTASPVEKFVQTPEYLSTLCWLLSGFLLAEWLYHSKRVGVRLAGVFAWLLLIAYVLAFGYFYVQGDAEMFRVLLATPVFYSSIFLAVGMAALFQSGKKGRAR